MQTTSVLPLRGTSGCLFDSLHLLLCSAQIRTLVAPLIKHDITLEGTACSDYNREGHSKSCQKSHTVMQTGNITLVHCHTNNINGNSVFGSFWFISWHPNPANVVLCCCAFQLHPWCKCKQGLTEQAASHLLGSEHTSALPWIGASQKHVMHVTAFC